jgi:cellulose synthase (UDP-forming)
LVTAATVAPVEVSVLPTRPTDDELSRYEHRRVGVLLGVSLISISGLAVSQVRFTQLSPWLLVVLPALAFTILYYFSSLVINLRSRNFNFAAHSRMVERWRPVLHPSVDVLLPICKEGIDVLVNTWRHVAAMAEHYPGSVHVVVLDDGADEHAESAAHSFGFDYVVRPDPGVLKKAGNLRHGFQLTDGKYVAIFDADFCPRPDFLDHLVPYAEADPTLGIVQSPQYFRTSAEQTWMERGASAVQELFYRVVQVSRDQLGGAICVGSCAVYRREALAEIGGNYPIEHSEDVYTGFELGRRGWRLKYVPVPLATGLCPETPDAFLTQQYRWCTGSMSLLFSRYFWRTSMPWRARMCYLSGFCYYLHTAVFVMLTPAVPLLLILAEPQHVLLSNYLWILPSAIYTFLVFPLWNRVRYGPTAFMAKYLYGWAHLFALLDTLRGRVKVWQATGSNASRSSNTRIWRLMRIWGSLTGAVWIGGVVVRATQFGASNWILMGLSALAYVGVFGMALRAHRTATARS